MKRPDDDRLNAMSQRNESDMRMIGGIVGVVCGGFVGFYIEMRAMRGMSMWGMLIIPLIAAIIGGAVGYFKDTWRSGL
jgi:hypothetical protein